MNRNDRNTIYDCAIIGGGPGGLAAGIYLSRLRCNIKLIDKNDSRAALISQSHNFPGAVQGIAGNKILANLRKQYQKYGNPIILDTTLKLTKKSQIFIIQNKHSTLKAKNIILATGVLDIEPRLPNLEFAVKKGLIRHCLICDGYEVIDKKVAIIGQGKTLFKEAMLLKRYTENITLFSVSNQAFSSKEKKELAKENIKLVDDPIIKIIIKKKRIIALKTKFTEYKFDSIYSALGAEVRSELAIKLGAKHLRSKCLVVNHHQQTSIPGLYAIGDIVPGLNQICVAMSQGAIAAVHVAKVCREKKQTEKVDKMTHYKDKNENEVPLHRGPKKKEPTQKKASDKGTAWI